MATALELDKAKRGTKRVCPECATRFYDLLRESIACPSCGVAYVPAAQPAAVAAAPASPYGGKGSWRGKPYKRPDPLPPKEHPEPETETDDVGIDDETRNAEPADTMEDDDVVLEQEGDDVDLSNLVEHGEEERKEEH
jgi:uncharacterized protein (TIGR02300 family)